MNEVSNSEALLDTCLYRWTALSEYCRKRVDISFGGQLHPVDVLGRKKAALPTDWRLDEINAIPTLIRLVRDNRLSIYTSTEIKFEIFSGFDKARGVPEDMLSSIRVGVVPSPIERSKFQQMPIKEFVKKEKRVEFCEFLLNLGESGLRKKISRLSDLNLSDYEKESFEQLPRFIELCKDVSKKHYSDIFHLWTAERAGLKYFLTLDKKFINSLVESKKMEFISVPLTPSDLLSILGVAANEPLPYIDEDFQQIIDS